MSNDAAPISLLRHRPFALYWPARSLATVAFQMQSVAVGWQIYDLTGSALDLGLVGLVMFAPVILFVLVAGQVADRYDRRLVLGISLGLEAAALAVLALASAGGWLGRELIFAAVFVIGTARAFEMPAVQSLLPTLVPAALFPRAVAWSASAHQVASIAGPALGGLVYILSPAAAYGASGAILLLAAGLMARIPQPPPAKREPVRLGTLFAGFAFIRRQPILLGAMSLDLFAVLLSGATALLPIFAKDILGTGPWGLGLLRAAPGAGALASALYLARWPLKRRVGRVMFAAVAIFGLATIAFGLSASFALSLVALAALGAADMVSVVIRLSLVQLGTPDAMRGRVSAVNSMFIGASNRLGEFVAGVAAAAVGAIPAVLAGGVGTLLVVALWMRLFPALAAADRLEPPRQ
jgi:MFS family permease